MSPLSLLASRSSLLCVLGLLLPFILAAQDLVERSDWGPFFEGRLGCFVLFDALAESYSVWNAERAQTDFLPASTFKIPNSLIALETGVVPDLDTVIPWDGIERPFKQWNCDHTLGSALRNSVVPVYQEIARRVGETRMQEWVDRLDYGNRDIRGGIDVFWLEGGLRITALEQIRFLRRLHAGELPFSSASQAFVRQILLNEETDLYRLYAKTGFALRVSPGVAWWVGWVDRGEQTWLFACNLDASSFAEARARETITRAILTAEGILSEKEKEVVNDE